ncbi:hypothetical protein ACJMK2_021311 [Sinanodonta woodiana]|uniref:Uncharacterized protein n=1 Tax=Sinanodonta woodiana TaxID=1069815 RepID=A0ABD3TFQ5_SINWO
MMDRSLVIIILVSIQCIQSLQYMSSTEPDIQSDGQINTTQNIGIEAAEPLVTKSIYDCPDVPPFPAPQVYTAGRTMCRTNSVCGYEQGTSYKWCYTDFSNTWDYCCTGECNYYGAKYLYCSVGSTWQYCGNCLKKDIKGRPCLLTFPCGVHKKELIEGNRYYWCYVDLDLNWDYCCAPHSKCGYHSTSFNWCYIGDDTSSDAYRECVPEE